MARDQVLLPAASMACKAPARPKGSAGEMGSSLARRCSRGSAAEVSFLLRIGRPESDRADASAGGSAFYEPVASGCKALALVWELCIAIVELGLPPSDLSICKMILTQCAVCATDLGLTLGKKCGRCSTRYCGAACQEQHWKEGGHDKLCKPIKKQAAPNSTMRIRSTRRPSQSRRACAEDTKGQTCYICTQALHWKTKEGLVRGCSCRGTAGFAHVSCLAEQAKILVAEADENNLGP